MKKYSLSAMGRDRPGIVAALAEPLYRHGCNIEDSSMTILEGEFSVILIMSIPHDVDPQSLGAEIREAAERVSLTIDIKEIPEGNTRAALPLSNYIITLHGEDRTGIVYKTALLLAELNINITDLETKARHRKGGAGKDLYLMVMEVYIPEEVEMAYLRRQLDSLSEDLGVKISLNPIEDYGEL